MLKRYKKWRQFSSLMLLALGAVLTLSLMCSTQATNLNLRSLAQKQGLNIGAAVLTGVLQKEPTYRRVLAREFNMLTPENHMKFKPLHPERDRYDFAPADVLVDFAKENDMQVRGHTLVWHHSLPEWLEKGEWTREELMAILQEHIYTVVERYRGQVVEWDVVNEAIADDASLRKSIWLNVIGSDYIEMAFRWAHEADPTVKLFYNDYGSEGINSKSDAIYALVKSLRDRHVPIDGVGLQMHVRADKPPSAEKVAANMKRLGELGLEVHITEMDVKIEHATGTLEEKLTAQANVYRDMMQVCLTAENCDTFVLWGFTDLHSWIPRYLKQPDSPLIFDKFYNPKPAYDALVEVLN
ncbi:MAG: endo-1,4-beta-xylanase [Kastovskya adunca ATA6-11-RM4]|jgi:endo-1,4-beta-xylanase|nr:endo-1,4-beta-xylanase [Kastovskya adunca ATA6-11-RM4]